MSSSLKKILIEKKMIRQAQVVRPYNLDEYFLSLLKNIYKHRNLSVEVCTYLLKLYGFKFDN